MLQTKERLYTLTDKLADVEDWISELPQTGGVIAVDTETTGLNWGRDKLLLIQLRVEGRPALIIDARRMPLISLGHELHKVLEDTAWLKIGHNLAFDYKWLKYHCKVTIRRLFDTMIAEKLLTAGILTAEANLAAVANKYLNVTLDKAVRNEFIGFSAATFSSSLLDYSARDVTYLKPIMHAQIAQLKRHGLMELARLEFDVLPILCEAGLRGVLIDKGRWQTHIKNLEVERDRLEKTLTEEMQPFVEAYRKQKHADKLADYEAAHADYIAALSEWEAALEAYKSECVTNSYTVPGGPISYSGLQEYIKAWKEQHPRPKKPAAPKCGDGPINLSSTDQLQGALAMMGVELHGKDGGNLKTDKGTLEFFKHDYPILDDILQWRAYAKLISAFGENILELTDKGGRLHPQFVQTVSTGRMSCRAPNVQQVPANELGQEFRRCFIAAPNHKLIAADYSQIELRVLAEVSGEPTMLDAFDKGIDLHSQTAASMTGIPASEIEAEKEGKYKQIRRAAKAINFGIAYGLTKWGLARALKISVDEADSHIQTYFAQNSRVRSWLDNTANRGNQTNESRTIMGRARFFLPMPAKPRIDWQADPDPRECERLHKEKVREWERRKAGRERAMCNHPIQGSSADITKRAIVRIHNRFKAAGLGAVIVMVVHDEIVVEAHETEAVEVEAILKEEMTGAALEMLTRVPIKVDAAISEYWHH